MTTQTKTIQELAAETKAAILAPTTELKARMAEMEQRWAAMPSGGSIGGAPTWGEQIANEPMLEQLRTKQADRVRFEMKDISGAATSAGGMVDPMRDPTVNAIAGRVPRIRDLLTVVNTMSGSVEYLDQTTRTNNAGMQAEGALKGESDYQWELRNIPVRTIAHWVRATVQILDDAPQLQSTIDGELAYGLSIAEDQQLLTGDGTGENLNGLITNATPYAPSFAPANENMIDKIGLGLLQVTLADYMPNGIAVHPSDWMRMRLLKDADGKYLLGDPGADVQPVLFGQPVVPTTAIPIDNFLVGDFARAGTLYDRQAPTIAVSTEDRDNFVTNRVTIRAEERVALAFKNATALSYGSFTTV